MYVFTFAAILNGRQCCSIQNMTYDTFSMSTPCSQCPINENMIPRFFFLSLSFSFFSTLLLLSLLCYPFQPSINFDDLKFMFFFSFSTFWLQFLTIHTHSAHNCYDSHTDPNEHIEKKNFIKK